MKIIALDFDGVICDSVVEMALSGYQAAHRFWPETMAESPGNEFVETFTRLRPVIKTGFESILLAKLIQDQREEREILTGFNDLAIRLQNQYALNPEKLKSVFARVRDHWIEFKHQEWLDIHQFYPGIIKTLIAFIANQYRLFIITTKEKRFARQLLDSQNININADCYFGLKDGRKTDVLADLVHRSEHKESEFYFVEDRLKTLEEVCSRDELKDVQLYLASWGYNTEAQRRKVESSQRINLLDLEQFPDLAR